jgi:NAD+ kinase
MARLGIYDDGSAPHSVDVMYATLKHEGAVKISPGSVPPAMGCIIVPGGDRGVRKYYLDTNATSVPVLGVSEGETKGLLAQVDVKDVHRHTERLRAANYSTDEIARLEVVVDGTNRHQVLNDATVCSARSAVLMEYLLTIDGEEFWHDSGDGVIVSTPLGSTAYAMSAGGPVIFAGSPVFGITSINSQDVERRPLVVPQDSVVEVSEISSRRQCEVVLDGAERANVKESVRFSKSGPPARIVRLRRNTISISAMAKRHHLSEDLFNMAPSAKLLLKTLEYEGTLSRKKLAERTMLPDRTVRMSLSRLIEKGYVKRRVSARDARQKMYEIAQPAAARDGQPGREAGT